MAFIFKWGRQIIKKQTTKIILGKRAMKNNRNAQEWDAVMWGVED